MADVNSRAVWRYAQLGAAWLLAGAMVAASPDTPKFDGRAWTVGHQQRNDQQSITEYVLPGQTVDNWKELVTSEVFFKSMPVAVAVKMFEAKLSRGCPSLVFKVIRQDEQTAVIEWRDSGCGGFEPSSELARFALEKDGLYRLAYSVKGSLRSEKRKDWMAILDKTPPAEGTARGSTREARSEVQDPERAALMAKVTQVLAGFVRQNGECTNPKAELKDQTPGPAGPLSKWSLECSEAQYTILVQPNGAMTAIRR